MAHNYIEQRDGGYYIAGTRVPLECIAFEFGKGASVESIRQTFPALTLEEVYGAVAFYISHRDVVETSMREAKRAWQEFEANHPLPDAIRDRLHKASSERPRMLL